MPRAIERAMRTTILLLMRTAELFRSDLRLPRDRYSVTMQKLGGFVKPRKRTQFGCRSDLSQKGSEPPVMRREKGMYVATGLVLT
jgi:hypothetical protein